MIENVTNLSSAPALSDPSWISKIDVMPVSAIIAGAIIAGLVGIAAERVNQHFKERSTKKCTSRVLLSEIEANQNLLQPLSDSLDKRLDSDNEDPKEDTLPNELNFERTIYSALTDKIGLLDNKRIKKVVQYYIGIKYIEEQYKKLELIHGVLPSFLGYIELKDETGRLNHINNSPGWDEIEKFLRDTEKVYNLGKELIKCLNGEI